MESSDGRLPDPRFDLTKLKSRMLDVHGEQSEAVRRSPSRPDIATS
jgi:hypothetical protein